MCDPEQELKNLGDEIGDLAGDVGDALGDAVEWIGDEILDPVVDTVEGVVKGMLDDPIKTIAQIAAIATQQYWALPLIEGADVAAAGGDLEDVLKATAKAYVAQELGTAAGKYAYQGTVGTAYGAGAGQQAAQLAAQEAGMRTAADIAGQIIGAGAASASSGIVYGRDPIEALKLGIVSAGSSQLVGLALGELDRQTGGTFAQLKQNSPTAASAIESAITAQLTGQDVTAAVISSAIRTSKIATQLVDQFTKDNPDISEAQKALAAQVITNVTATAFAGGDPSRALQATLMQIGSKALGDLAKTEFKEVLDNIQQSYKDAEIRANAIDKNISEQERVAAEYNSLGGELNAKVAEQDRLREQADAARAEANKAVSDYNSGGGSLSREQVEALTTIANEKTTAYNNYAEALGKDYNDNYKARLDTFSNQLSSLQTEYEGLVVDYETGLREIQNATQPLQVKYDELYSNTAQVFVQAMDPNFNADEYKEINGLGDDIDIYEHWLSEGQFEGLKTNQKDVSVSQAIDDYIAEFGSPPPEHVLGKLMDPTNPDRDSATELFVNNAIKDKQAEESYKTGVRDRIIDFYRSEGLSDAQINEIVSSGEVDNYVNSVMQDARNAIDAQKDYVNKVAERYGTDSSEYRDAYRNTLNAMAEVGGYGVVKDGNDYVVDAGARINGDTLQSSLVYLGENKGWLDPVTGQIHSPFRIDITGTAADPEYSSIFALGQSAKPPEQGGESVFGDGSGVSSGLFGGLTPIARDQETGATLYGGDNGFALIAYADGRGSVVNTKTQEVIWVSPEDTQEILNTNPVAESTKPVEANPDIAAPVAPTPTNPIENIGSEIKEKFQSPTEVKSAFESLGYTPTQEEINQFIGQKSFDELIEQLNPYIDPRLITDEEAKIALQSLGIENPSQKDIDKLKGQYAQSELEGKAGALDIQELRYNALTDQIKDLSGGVKISDELANKFNTLTADQKSLADQLVQQGVDLNTAINQATAATQEQISGVQQDIQTKYNALSEAQKAEVDARVAMGNSLQSAIDGVSSQVSQEIEGVKTDIQTKFDALTDQQKGLATQLTQQGVDLNTAIETAKAGLGTQISGVSAEVEELARQQELARQEAEEAARQAQIRDRVSADKLARSQQQAKAQDLAQQQLNLLTGAQQPVPADEAAKFKSPFLTSAAKQEEFKGTLEDFMKEVQTGDYTQDQFSAPQSQTTPQMQQNIEQGGLMPNYFTYGQQTDLDQLFNPFAGVGTAFSGFDSFMAAKGGLATPLMAAGGVPRYAAGGALRYAGGGLPVVHHSGKMRVDFRQGDAVTGPGDGQSDDIPAMLADGEFVIPADVVAALGNGSTKAGSDKLYDMMHSIREHHRAARPKDLPPPAKGSPLDYLKGKKPKSARR